MKGEKQREGEREREEAENVGKAGGARREEEGGRREREICTQERTREKERVTACVTVECICAHVQAPTLCIVGSHHFFILSVLLLMLHSSDSTRQVACAFWT